MVEAVLDAFQQQAVDLADRLGTEILADGVGAQRQRQVGFLEPPLAQVDDQMQILLGVGELAFVDDQPGVDRLALVLAGDHDIEDFVERNDDMVEINAQTHPQAQIGGG